MTILSFEKAAITSLYIFRKRFDLSRIVRAGGSQTGRKVRIILPRKVWGLF
jgi:hypothetical protein